MLLILVFKKFFKFNKILNNFTWVLINLDFFKERKKSLILQGIFTMFIKRSINILVTAKRNQILDKKKLFTLLWFLKMEQLSSFLKILWKVLGKKDLYLIKMLTRQFFLVKISQLLLTSLPKTWVQTVKLSIIQFLWLLSKV